MDNTFHPINERRCIGFDSCASFHFLQTWQYKLLNMLTPFFIIKSHVYYLKELNIKPFMVWRLPQIFTWINYRFDLAYTNGCCLYDKKQPQFD